MTCVIETRAETLKITQMLHANEIKVLRKILCITKTDSTKIQQFIGSFGIQLTNE